jgi:hypothetical protein
MLSFDSTWQWNLCSSVRVQRFRDGVSLSIIWSGCDVCHVRVSFYTLHLKQFACFFSGSDIQSSYRLCSFRIPGTRSIRYLLAGPSTVCDMPASISLCVQLTLMNSSPQGLQRVWKLPEPSDSKIWRVPSDSEPRMTVQARPSSNLAVRQSVDKVDKDWLLGA